MSSYKSNTHTRGVIILVLLVLVLFSIDRVCVTLEPTAIEKTSARSTTVERTRAIADDDDDKDVGIKEYTSSLMLISSRVAAPRGNVTVGLVDYCVGDSFETLKHLVMYNRKVYADKWNYTIFSGSKEEFPMQTFVEPLAWLKAAYFYQLLSSTHSQQIDWFVWLDCDALITRFDLRVDDVLNDLNTRTNHHVVVAKDPHTEFNSGVMFVRNSVWSRGLWARTLQKASNVAIRQHKWWEQQALLELYRKNQFNESSHILITPHRWKINAFQTFRRNEYNASSFALHRVNCRKQPECNTLFEALFCLTMPNETYPKDLVDCSNATDTFMKTNTSEAIGSAMEGAT